MAYNVSTGVAREVSRDGRDYLDLSPAEIPCTADVVGTLGDSVYVGDYKTGNGWLPDPADSWQLLLGALCASIIAGKDSAVVEYVKLVDPTNPRKLRAELGFFDLQDFARRLRELWTRVATMRANVERVGLGNIRPVEGPHCRYCPAFDACPKKRNLLANVESGALDHDVRITWADITPANAAQCYRQFLTVDQLAKRMRSAIYAYAGREPIDLGDGRMFGKVDKAGNERIDGDAAYPVIVEMLGSEFAEDACGRTCTKSGIRGALSKHAAKGTRAKRERELLAALRGAGAATRKESSAVEEYSAKELKAG